MSDPELFRRIVIGLDPEGRASDALIRGLDLAKGFEARPTVVHAVEIHHSHWPGLSEKELASLHAAALVHSRNQALAVVEQACGAVDFEGAEADDILRAYTGHAAHVILTQAERLDADLVVLGPHVKRTFLDFGGTARAVLARSHVPVWIQSGMVLPIRRILVAVDFSDHSRRALDFSRAMALRLNASLRVLHAYAPPAIAYTTAAEAFPGPTYVVDHERDEARRTLAEWMDSYDWSGLDVDSAFVLSEATPAIARAAESMDLVVMGTHGRTGLTRFLLGSVAYATLKRTPAPVLVVPTTKETWLIPEPGPTRASKRARVRVG